MSKPSRVLWLAKGLGRGGAEQLLVTSARHVDPARFSIDVAYLLPEKDALVPDLRESGIRVHCLEQRANVDPRWALRLHRLLTNGAYDIVHTHMPLPAVAARLSLLGRRTKLVHTEHNVWLRYRLPTRWANALTYPMNDRVIAVSEAVSKSIFRRVGASRRTPVEVLHHGVELGVRGAPNFTAYVAARDRLGISPDELVVGTVGNLTEKKDHSALIEAHEVLLKRVPTARLVIVGSGPLQNSLEQQIHARNLSGAVSLLGSRSDVPALLPAFDVFAMSSKFEGLSIALLEAMAAALPVVVTAVGGMPEVVSDGVQGLLVPARRPDLLAAALERVLVDVHLRRRLAMAASERAADFDIRNTTRRIEEIYDEVLAS